MNRPIQWTSRAILALLLAGATFTNANALQDADDQKTPTMQQADGYFQQEDWAKAAAAYDAITKADPKNGTAWFRLGYTLHIQGKLDEAIVAHQKAAEFAPNGPVAMYNLGCAYALKKMPDKAFETLEKAVAAGMRDPDQFEGDTDLDSLRDDPRYKQLLEKMRNAPPMTPRGAQSGDDPHRQFDFWVGDWEVLNPQGAKVGTNKISRVNNGYIILEEWSSANGGAGQSMNFYDPGDKQWKQVWVSGTGGVTYYSGEFKNGAMHFTGRAIKPDGSDLQTRMSFTPLSGGKVRQFIEHSDDDGKTWTTYFDGTYVKKGEKQEQTPEI